MTAQPFRLPQGGRVDRARPLPFYFDGHRLEGYAGDTLASALLANGVRLVGRSFKYHRPRGIMSAGGEEANALVRVRTGARAEPNLRATQVELYDGLVAESQNRWPSLALDLQAVNGWFSRLLPAGFYYKTFMWPAALWKTYERVIRASTGLGVPLTEPDPDRYEHRFAHTDVLVVGGGPAGLAAALAAGRAGARVIVCDETPALGGQLKAGSVPVDGRPAMDWVAAAAAELASLSDVVVLTRTTATSYLDHNMVHLCERVNDHMAEPPPFQARQRFWSVRARQVVLATGAIERPPVFADNDRPGVMLASAARAYVNQFAVRPGTRAVVFTNNDSAYTAAIDLKRAGVGIEALIDARDGDGGAAAVAAKAAGIERIAGSAVLGVVGRGRVEGVRVGALTPDGNGTVDGGRRIACDLVCVSGGWSPAVHLFSQSRGKLAYDPALAAFVPGASFQAERSAGAARGRFRLADCLADGFAAGAAAARDAGFGDGRAPAAPAIGDEPDERPLRALWAVALPKGERGKRFVDFQNDVTADDVALAAREGYNSVEHLKRYTTLGMGTDQGRTSNVNGLAILAGIEGRALPEVGTTTFRPPYSPIPLGTIAGHEVGQHFMPVRRSAMHHWHEKAGAAFVPAGLWLRPAYYARPGEDALAAIQREAKAVRAGVGIVDVSTLGKIDIQGADAGEFLDRIYINTFKTLPVGRARYGVMLREDGIVFDDGTTSRFAENRYFMTTTTANAVPVMRHLEYHAQVSWPHLDVRMASVSEDWAGVALAGPDSRKVLAKLAERIDVGNEGLPFMGVREGRVAGIPARVFRISFSGELAYEIYVPADYGTALWESLLAAGEEFGLIPYGVEAMTVLRIEKGHVVSGELNGRTTPDDLGFARMLSTKKDFIGRRSLGRPALKAAGRKQLVGLVAADGRTRIPRGGQIVADPHHALPNPMLGEVTSQTWSATLDKPIALAILADGRKRKGETLHVASPVTGKTVAVVVTDPVFVDPEGERLRG